MSYKYQLILLGDISNPACDHIKNLFFQRVCELGLQNVMFDVIYSRSFNDIYTNKQPSFAYYFGKIDHNNKDADILDILIKNGDAIFPICSGDNILEEIPDVIHRINGKKYMDSKNDEYVNYALEAMRLLRKNRKLFISYRRTDSSGVANQLFEAFVKSNYDVFLDTYSINPAINFQDELHHRMTDCDVLIQLYTSDFKGSKWCNEEIISANQKQIGIVEVVWPNCTPDIHNLLCKHVSLSKEHFIDGEFHDANNRITDNAINTILLTVESVRARNLAARQDNLIGEFVAEAQKNNHYLIQEYQYLVETLDNGTMRLFIPAIGVPQSYDCYDSLRFRKILDNENIAVYLIYDDLCIRKQWIEHLEWLNMSLEVKTIKKKDFALWLKNN